MPTLQALMAHTNELEDRVALLEWLDLQLRALTEQRTEIRLGARTVGTAAVFALMAELEERRVRLRTMLEALWGTNVPAGPKKEKTNAEEGTKDHGRAGARGPR